MLEKLGAPAVVTRNAKPFDTLFGGFTAATFAVPGLALSPARIVAVNCVEDTYVVERLLPFHVTTAPDAKLAPLIVSVNGGPSATAFDGEIEIIEGACASVGRGGAALPDPQPVT
jgi:hypothetical protein